MPADDSVTSPYSRWKSSSWFSVLMVPNPKGMAADSAPVSSQAALVAGTGSVDFCQGHRPVISNSREKLRNVRMTTITARTPTLVKVGVTATVRMMSAATRSSRPRRMDRPSNCRYSPVERPVWGTAAFSEVSAAYGQRHRDHGADDHDRHSREVQVPPGGFNNE